MLQRYASVAGNHENQAIVPGSDLKGILVVVELSGDADTDRDNDKYNEELGLENEKKCAFFLVVQASLNMSNLVYRACATIGLPNLL